MSCCNKTNCGTKDKMKADVEPVEQKGLMGLLTGPRRWWLFGAVGVIAGLTFGWEQLVLFGIAPILISLLPCLVMCGLGLCMMKCKDKSKSVSTAVEQPVQMTADNSPVSETKASGLPASTRTF